jgi:HTH-type transcriptional regulator/antitoxin HipB
MKQTLTHANQVGQIIRSRRKALKLSQAALSAKLAISQNRLSQIESDPATLSLRRLMDLFNVLGLDLVVEDRATDNKVDW